MSNRVIELPALAGRTPRFSRSTILFLIIIVACLAFVGDIIVYVSPHEFAVKEVRIGVSRGIQKDVYPTGWTIKKPFGMERFHFFPRGVQILDLTNHPEERVAARTGRRTEKAAHIQTSDGFFVDCDISILYRIVDPVQVISQLGPGELYIDNGIIPRAEPILKQALGTLTTEEFYNSIKRTARVEEAETLLQAELEGKGLKLEKVLVRYFQYSPEIQRNIEEKKLKDQLVFKNQSEKRAAAEEAELKRIIQAGEARLVVKIQEGDSYEIEKRAEQELYSRKKHAEGDLQVQLAQAYSTDLRNTALQGSGSNKMVGLRMAEVLKGIQILVLPSDGASGLNPLNLNQMIKLFEGGSKSEIER